MRLLGFRMRLLLLALGASTAGLAGCTPHIGDHCNLNTDCSITGTLFCDTSQPNGYCTFFNCVPNGCQNNAVCVMLRPQVPGCDYNDYDSPSRTGRTMCLAPCSQDSDCRTGEGYVCRNPTGAPWDGIIMDNNQNQRVCVVDPSQQAPASFVEEAGVCQASGPDAGRLEAGVHLVDGGAPAEAGVDAGSDAADAGGGADAAPDAADAAGSD